MSLGCTKLSLGTLQAHEEPYLRPGNVPGISQTGALSGGPREPVQQTPPPKDSQFSVPIRTPVRVLDGREAPGKFSLLYIRFPVLGFEIPVPMIFFQYRDLKSRCPGFFLLQSLVTFW